MKVCPVCGKEFSEILPCGKKSKSKTCSKSCGALLRCKSVESNWKRKDVQDKAHASAKKTLLCKYGADNPAKISEIKEKIKETNTKKYGVPSILLVDSVKELSKASRNSKETRLKMSKSSKLNDKEIHNKGVLQAQTQEARQKRTSTCLQKYGVTSVLGSYEIHEKIKKTMDAKYPKGSVARSLITKRSKKTCLQKYGVEVGFFAKGYQSTGEAEVREFIKSLGFTGNQSNKVISGIQLDIYIPEKNFAIEYNGAYWHSDEIKQDRLYHWRRSKLCEEHGIFLFHIYEWEWKDLIKREIIKSVLKIALGKPESKIFARECKVKSVSTKDYRNFCDRNHLQGYRHASVVLGLYYKDELKQLMSFNKPQKRGLKESYEWEIVRGCPGSNNIVIGGVSKLWKAFIRKYNPISVMSYCDMNKFSGKSYELIGMSLAREERSNLYLVDKKTFKVTQWIYRNKEKREEQEKSSYKIYGVGNKTFIWKR